MIYLFKEDQFGYEYFPANDLSLALVNQLLTEGYALKMIKD